MTDKNDKHLVPSHNGLDTSQSSAIPKPARLPVHSRAAAAQRLNDLPRRPARGVYYPVPHRLVQPTGWRTRRSIKRRALQRSNQQFAAIDRIGTQVTMLPMAICALAIMVALTGLLVTLTAAVEATQLRYQQDVVTLADILPGDSLKMYDEYNTLIYQMVDQGLQTSVPLDQISPDLIHAEIATEDQNFWNDPGYDITGIVRAAIADLTNGRVVSGGSTITQQLIKNAIVGNQDTILRKLQEIILAPEVTRYYTKQQILSMYLNTIYYGEQAYGADAAAFLYFGLQDKFSWKGWHPSPRRA
jgi:membrane peptidoglycan carboxypeptidase